MTRGQSTLAGSGCSEAALASRAALAIPASAAIFFCGSEPGCTTPQDDVRIAIQRSHALLSDTAQLFDALDARSNFEPIMQSVRDLNKLDDS